MCACGGGRKILQQTFHGIENIRSLLPILRCIGWRIHKGGLLYQEDDIAGLNGVGLVFRIRQIGFDLRCNLPRFRSAAVQSVFHCGGDVRRCGTFSFCQCGSRQKGEYHGKHQKIREYACFHEIPSFLL